MNNKFYIFRINDIINRAELEIQSITRGLFVVGTTC